MALKPMGPIERAINTLIDFERQIKLLKQDLYAELPKRRIRTGEPYFIDHTGKRQYYLRKPKKVANEKD